MFTKKGVELLIAAAENYKEYFHFEPEEYAELENAIQELKSRDDNERSHAAGRPGILDAS